MGCAGTLPFGSGLAPAAASPVISGDAAGHWAALVEAEVLAWWWKQKITHTNDKRANIRSRSPQADQLSNPFPIQRLHIVLQRYPAAAARLLKFWTVNPLPEG